jgi:hypothetical protein
MGFGSNSEKVYNVLAPTFYTGMIGIKLKMEPRDVVLSIVMVVSAFVMTAQWLEKTEYAKGDAVIVLSAMVLIAALAMLMLSIELRLRRIEEKIEATERGLRVNLQSVEDNVGKQLTVTRRFVDSIDEMRRVAHR